MSRPCPQCRKTLTRLRRKRWMHYIPGSKNYFCRDCRVSYLLVFNLWLLKRKEQPEGSISSRKS